MPFSIPGTPPPSDTGTVSAPMAGAAPAVSSPMAGPVDPSAMLPNMGLDPSTLQYRVETQSDGTLLLRILNPDGSLGPVVQHMAAPKPKTGGK